MEVGMAGRTAADGVRLLERALRTKQLMEVWGVLGMLLPYPMPGRAGRIIE